MQYREYRPSAPLSPYVDCFWGARSGRQVTPPARELLLPDGTAQLLLSFGGSYRRFADVSSEQGVRVAGSHVLGARSTGIFIEQDGDEDIFAIRFRPGALYPFLRIPPSELVQRSVELKAASGAFADELEARIFEAATPLARVRVAERMLLERLRGGAEAHPGAERVVRDAIQRIYASRGTVSVHQIARAVGVGYRTLDRAFAHRVGIAPKRLCRIVRFNHALLLLKRGMESASVAHAAGYADQAHMIRDFRELARTTPGDLLARHYRIVDVSQPGLERRLSNTFNTER